MVAETAGGRQSWKAVSLEEYKSITKRSPHFLPSFGVVQLMAQVASLHMAANVGTMSEVNHDMHLRLNPQVLQNSTSSCIYASYDVATPLLSIENIEKMAGRARFGIVSSAPDLCPANIRTLAGVYQKLPANVLVAEGMCAGHKFHRIIATATKEDVYIGDIHAIAFSASLPDHRELLLKKFWLWIDSNYQKSQALGCANSVLSTSFAGQINWSISEVSWDPLGVTWGPLGSPALSWDSPGVFWEPPGEDHMGSPPGGMLS